MPLTFLTDSVINKNEAFFKKARLSPELTQLETAIKLVHLVTLITSLIVMTNV